jgi:hypothetical protein
MLALPPSTGIYSYRTRDGILISMTRGVYDFIRPKPAPIPLLEDIIMAFDRGEIAQFDGAIQYRTSTNDTQGIGWIPYEEIKALHGYYKDFGDFIWSGACPYAKD